MSFRFILLFAGPSYVLFAYCFSLSRFFFFLTFQRLPIIIVLSMLVYYCHFLVCCSCSFRFLFFTAILFLWLVCWSCLCRCLLLCFFYVNACFNFIISRLFIMVISMLFCDAFACVSWCLPILLIFHVNTCKLLVFNSPILVNLMADAFLCFMLPSFCPFCTILSVAASPAGYSN